MKSSRALLVVLTALLAGCERRAAPEEGGEAREASQSILNRPGIPSNFNEIPDTLKDQIPSLVIDGRRVAVSREAFIKHYVKSAKERDVLVPVPDGWNTDGCLVETATGKTVISFSGPAGISFFGDLSDDEQWLASSKIFSRKITLWHFANREELMDFPEMAGQPQSVKFSKDSLRITARCTKGEVIIWERESGRELIRVMDSTSSLEDILERVPAG